VRWPPDHDLVDDAFPTCNLSGDRLVARLFVMEHRNHLLQTVRVVERFGTAR